MANRGASIRIPRECAAKGYGYFEDRRPASNADPYSITGIISTCIIYLDGPSPPYMTGADDSLQWKRASVRSMMRSKLRLVSMMSLGGNIRVPGYSTDGPMDDTVNDGLWIDKDELNNTEERAQHLAGMGGLESIEL